jgi:hypothetical protein
MRCKEAIRLRAEYDAAFSGWYETLFIPEPGRLDTDSRLKAVLLRLVAMEARNEAAARLVSHQQACAICRLEDL